MTKNLLSIYICFLFIFCNQSVFAKDFDLNFTCDKYKCVQVIEKLKSLGCMPTETEKTIEPDIKFINKNGLGLTNKNSVHYTSSKCYFVSSAENCRVHYDKIDIGDSLQGTSVCHQSEMILSCDTGKDEKCLEKKISFYKKSCKLQEKYRFGTSGEVEVQDKIDKTKYRQIKSTIAAGFKSENCISVNKRSICPELFELKSGYEDEYYCFKSINANTHQKKVKPNSLQIK